MVKLGAFETPEFVGKAIVHLATGQLRSVFRAVPSKSKVILSQNWQNTFKNYPNKICEIVQKRYFYPKLMSLVQELPNCVKFGRIGQHSKPQKFL